MAELCPGCAVDYPEGYLVPFEFRRKETLPVCGCCALELANQVSRQKIMYFRQGTFAEQMRRLAIDWRRESHARPRPLAVRLPL